MNWGLLGYVSSKGRASISLVSSSSKAFYQERKTRGIRDHRKAFTHCWQTNTSAVTKPWEAVSSDGLTPELSWTDLTLQRADSHRETSKWRARKAQLPLLCAPMWFWTPPSSQVLPRGEHSDLRTASGWQGELVLLNQKQVAYQPGQSHLKTCKMLSPHCDFWSQV